MDPTDGPAPTPTPAASPRPGPPDHAPDPSAPPSPAITGPAGTPPASAALSGLRFHMLAAGTLGFAHQQAGVQALHRIELHWDGPAPLAGATLRFRTEPAFADTRDIRLADLAPGQSVVLADRDLALPLSPAFLAGQRERLSGRIIAEVLAGDPPGVLAGESHPVTLLACNEWPGMHRMPEMLAAFVTPNTPSVTSLLAAASTHLLATTGSASINGYSGEQPDRPLRLVEAAYLAVRDAAIAYAVPPASFETHGQKIRFPDEVLTSRLGTCLDLAVLFAAVLEQMGLRPLLLIASGHAWAGCWLRQDGLDTPAADDAQFLRKRFDEGHLTVFETTLAAAGSSSPFAVAESEARGRLEDGRGFHLAIDVLRARAEGVLPLPVQVRDGAIVITPTPQPSPADPVTTLTPGEIARRLPPDGPTTAPTLPAGRIRTWANQLLDLSLRNRLLNFGRGRALRVHTHAIDVLEDTLMSTQDLRLLPLDEPPQAAQPAPPDAPPPPPDRTALADDIANRRLRVDGSAPEVEKTLLALSRDARLAVEEGGANTLFLALGILEWRESPRSARSHLAPLLLMPVAIERPSVRSAFRLRRLDEDTRVNVTLLEKLRRDFRIEVPDVDPPPEDETGVDVRLVLQRFRAAVRESPGFEVHEDAWIGHFQFTKFLLWKDLVDRSADLRRSPIVRHLIDSARQPFVHPVEAVPPERLDADLPPARNHCILESDSSQLAAIASAAAGLPFVMIGPPGTGKSQTISNLIAFLIAAGKTVLFVAEKRAALEVVQRRLDRAGLGPFCLELHSNKAGKNAVLEQLRRAVDFMARQEPAEWASETAALERERDRLNATVRALHHRLPNGYSAFRCHGILVGSGAGSPRLTFSDLSTHTPEHVRALRANVAELARRLPEFPDRGSHPLAPVRQCQWTPSWEDDALDALRQLAAAAPPLAAAAGTLLGRLFAAPPTLTLDRLEALRLLAQRLPALPAVAPAFVLRSRGELEAPVRDALAAVARRDAARQALAGWRIDATLTLDLPTLRATWVHARTAFFLVRPFRTGAIRKSLAPLRHDGSRPATTGVDAFLDAARELQESEAGWIAAGSAMAPLLGPLWNHGSPDAAAAEAALDWLRDFGDAARRFAGADPHSFDQLLQGAAAIIRSAPDPAAPGAPLLQASRGFAETAATFAAAWSRSAALLALDLPSGSHDEITATASTLASTVTAAAGDLRGWCQLNALRKTATDAGLAPLLEAADNGGAPSDLPHAFETGYAAACLRSLMEAEPILRDFRGDTHGSRIDEFRRLDESLLSLAAGVVAAAVAARRPARVTQDDKPVAFGETGILNRELAKRSRHLPIRRLLQQVPTILPLYKPVLLMSPLSVAQYLDAAHPPFDAVVFDEASQVPVAEAIGAMARGTQVIVAGDPRQLPPTTFFQRGSSDDEADAADLPVDASPDATVLSDAESILDECLAAGLPRVHLRWHYRSRHESLIAFSNHHYYEGRLLTHPEPWSGHPGVSLRRISGAYDRSGSATNRAEAVAIVDEIRRHFTGESPSRDSIGVVTFNIAQQRLIEDLLEDARRESPELDDALAAARDEPLFIKNLENVQGDERDIIVFSITYGPDQAGRVTQNFGPLNQAGGERRLNVAITRARRGIRVFSSLLPEHIDLTRTRAPGVRHLRQYLEYAARGPGSLAATVTDASLDRYDSLFEEKVAGFLRASGFEVHTQVGCSDYRIDIAVLHPAHPGRYALGVECDGRAYHASATARDRDRLRQRVLEGLGWRIHRIWSSDWFRSESAARSDLLAAVKAALEASPEETPPPAPPSPPAPHTPVPPPPGDRSTPTGPGPADAYPEASDEPPPTVAEDRTTRLQDEKKPDAGAPGQAAYRPWSGTGGLEGADPYDRFAAPRLRAAIAEVIAAEGPVSASLLTTRIATALGMRRISRKLEVRIGELVPRESPRTVSGGQDFFWPPGSSPDLYSLARRHDDASGERRALTDIPAQEQRNALRDVLQRFHQMPAGDLLRQAALVFGWSSLTSATRAAFQPGLDLLRQDPSVIADDSGFRLRR